MIYGLVAPGYEMADIVATNLCGGRKTFAPYDMSTKLKLIGVDVATLAIRLCRRQTAAPWYLKIP